MGVLDVTLLFPLSPFPMKLSEFVKKQVVEVLKTEEERGFIYIRRRVVRKLEFDIEECDQILEDFCIRKESVLRYLGGKYIPTYMKKREGAVFRNQSCLQKCFIDKNGTLVIHIKNSEPHKIITDISHCYIIMGNKGIFPTPNLKLIIEQTKTFMQNIPLYTQCCKDWNIAQPYQGRYYKRKILAKYDTLEKISSIKFSVIKKKLLMYYLKCGLIDRTDMYILVKNQNYRESYIKRLCKGVYESHGVKRIRAA